MQSVSSRIWTRVAVSNSYDDNDYTTGTSNRQQLYDIKYSYSVQICRYIISTILSNINNLYTNGFK